jgi:hypothetical protein
MVAISCVDKYPRNGQPNNKHMSCVQGQMLNVNGIGALLRHLLNYTRNYDRIEIMHCMALQSRTTTKWNTDRTSHPSKNYSENSTLHPWYTQVNNACQMGKECLTPKRMVAMDRASETHHEGTPRQKRQTIDFAGGLLGT